MAEESNLAKFMKLLTTSDEKEPKKTIEKTKPKKKAVVKKQKTKNSH